MDGERRLHDLPGSPARRRGAPGRPSPEGTAWRPGHRACRSRPRQVRGRLTTKIHLACEQGQTPLAILVTAGQRGDSPQFTAVLEAIRAPCDGPGRPRARPDRVRGDKGLFLPGQSGLPAPTRYHLHHSRAGRPDPQPQAPWPLGRQAAGVRPRGLQGASCRRVRDQSPQAPPSRRLPLRQARRPIPGDRARRCDRRVAVRGRRPGMPSCPAIAIRVPRRFRDPTYHRADSENGDHIDDPCAERHQRHRVRDRLVAQRAVAAQANKLRRQRSTTWPSVPRGSGGRRL